MVGDRLPDIRTKADRDVIVQLALSRRGEIIQVSNLERVFCLEVDAQGRILFSPARTFASGGDIHAMPIGVGSFDPDYRPARFAGNVGDADRLSAIRAGTGRGVPRTLRGGGREDATSSAWRRRTPSSAGSSTTRRRPVGEGGRRAGGVLRRPSKNKFNPDKIGYPSIEDLINRGLRTTLVAAGTPT